VPNQRVFRILVNAGMTPDLAAKVRAGRFSDTIKQPRTENAPHVASIGAVVGP
jgi:hypothetical protein